MKLLVGCLAAASLAVAAGMPLRVSLWGPGLRGEFVLPVRYIFIQFDDENDQRFTNLSMDLVKVEMRSKPSGKIKEYQSDLLRTSDDRSRLLFRFRPHVAHEEDLVLTVFYDNKKAASEIIKGPILPEKCNCPVGIQRWLVDVAKCPKISDQILNDLAPFSSGRIRPGYNREIMEKYYDQPYSVSLCNYVIKNNEIYRKCLGEYTGFKMFMDSVLLSLVRKVKLPDVDFLVNLGDYPLAKKTERRYSPQVPIFSWCGSEDSMDIVMPTYELTEASVHMMRRVAVDVLSVQDRASQPYSERQFKAFWRGRDSREERLRLVELSQRNPQLLNASITNFFFFRDRMEKYGGGSPHVSFFDFFEYKYQINIDGTVAAYRMPFLLSGGSTVLKPGSIYYEHFYSLLKEDVHYVPVHSDLSDLLAKIEFCIENEEHCAQIARNGRQLVNDALLPHHVYCYYAQLLQEYSKHIEGPVKVQEDMELVEHDEKSACNCPRWKKDEL